MAWAVHKIVFRLCSPLHVGAAKVGNLQRTRRYVTGRVLWGAFTARLTRDGHPDGRPRPDEYAEMGDRVQKELAFSYLYPKSRADEKDPWPWEDGFDYRFLSSYASTALNPRHGSAEEASLHEIECITPYTRKGEPVYLTGYLFVRQGSDLEWESVLDRLQLGGERGYGWGQVKAISSMGMGEEQPQIFDCCDLDLTGERPIITVPKCQRLLAHVLAADFNRAGQSVPQGEVDGAVEPLVGRDTRAADHFGGHVSVARICYLPHSKAEVPLKLQIGFYGILEQA